MAAYLFHAKILAPISAHDPSSGTSRGSRSLNHSTLDPRSPSGRRKRALELGSGVGYLSLCFAHRGWDVVSTDIEPALSSVLRPNIAGGREVLVAHAARDGPVAIERIGNIRVEALDWMDSPPCSAKMGAEGSTDDLVYLKELVGDGLDVIFTTDTLYSPSIVQPLWNTIWHLSVLTAQANVASSSSSAGTRTEISFKQTYPTVYLALENRDPTLIDNALKTGRGMGFDMRRIPNVKLAKALGETKRKRIINTACSDGSEEDGPSESGLEAEAGLQRSKAEMDDGAGWGWEREDWEGVEVWRIKLT